MKNNVLKMGGGILLALALIASITFGVSSCKKDISSSDGQVQAPESTERERNPCWLFPHLVGLSYQTVMYNDMDQIQALYNNFVDLKSIDADADHLVYLHEIFGQPTALNYLRTNLGFSIEEIELLQTFLNQSAQFDLNNMSLSTIETFTNGYRDYLCREYSKPRYSSVQAEELKEQGMVLASNLEGTWKGLLQLKQLSERSIDPCAECHFKARYIIGYNALKGASTGKLAGPKGVTIGAIVGALYGVYKAHKLDACKKCYSIGIDPEMFECEAPIKIAVLPVSCTDFSLRLAFPRLPPGPINWLNQNAIPASAPNIGQALRIFVPNMNLLTQASVTYPGCNGQQENITRSFLVKDEFLAMGDFSISATSSVSAGNEGIITIVPAKIWNSDIYDISYELVSGFQGTIKDTNNGPLMKKFVPNQVYTPGITTIRVTISSKCSNVASVSKIFQINVN